MSSIEGNNGGRRRIPRVGDPVDGVERKGPLSKVLAQIENTTKNSPTLSWIHDIKQRVELHTQSVKSYIEHLALQKAIVTPIGSFSRSDCTLMYRSSFFSLYSSCARALSLSL